MTDTNLTNLHTGTKGNGTRGGGKDNQNVLLELHLREHMRRMKINVDQMIEHESRWGGGSTAKHSICPTSTNIEIPLPHSHLPTRTTFPCPPHFANNPLPPPCRCIQALVDFGLMPDVQASPAAVQAEALKVSKARLRNAAQHYHTDETWRRRVGV